MTKDRFVREIEEKMSSGENLNEQGEAGISLLHYWVSADRPDIVELLIESGADLNVQDHSGRTALHFAVANGNLDLVRLLVQRGANANIASARSTQNRSFMQRLLGKYRLITPLQLAVDGNHQGILEFIRDHAEAS